MRVIKHKDFVNLLPENAMERIWVMIIGLFVGTCGITAGGFLLTIDYTQTIDT